MTKPLPPDADALTRLTDALRGLTAVLEHGGQPTEPPASEGEHDGDRRRVCGANLIAREREEHTTREGFDPVHDLTHTGQELAWAAFCYLERATATEPDRDDPPAMWPWTVEAWKPGTDRIRMLVKAGSLIASEIDRLLATDGVPGWAKESGES